jgi:hypothetical protein
LDELPHSNYYVNGWLNPDPREPTVCWTLDFRYASSRSVFDVILVSVVFVLVDQLGVDDVLIGGRAGASGEGGEVVWQSGFFCSTGAPGRASAGDR